MARVYIETFGCWLNKGESNIMATLLKRRGHKVVESIENADVVILNTCAVRGDTETKIFRRLRELEELRQKRGFRLVVSGCLVNVRPKSILDVAPSASLVEPDAIEKIPEVVESEDKLLIVRQYKASRNVLPDYSGGAVHVVPIESGCLGSCAFCIEWVTRGTGVKSYPIDVIVENVRAAVSKGAREIFLTGQDVAAYGYDLGTNLYELVKRILEEVDGEYRVRLGMMEPMLLGRFLKNLLELFRDERLYRYFHIPAQSGDDKVLRLMRRKYTVEEYKGIVNTIRGSGWKFSIVTDIIVGFPGEGEAEFQNTLKFLREVMFDKVHVARYTFRPFTEGYVMSGVPEPVKKQRSRLASRVALEVAYEINRSYVGEEREVVVEGTSIRGDLVGRTIEYKPVVIKDQEARVGEIVRVKIVDATPVSLIGKVLA